MVEDKDEYYVSLLGGEYIEESDRFKVDIKYKTSISPGVIERDAFIGGNKIPSMFDELRDDDRSSIFLIYDSSDLRIDNAYYETFSDLEKNHWMDWFIQRGYSEFVDQIQELTEAEGEIFLVACDEDLSSEAIEETAETNLQSRKDEWLRSHTRNFRSY